MSNKNKHPHVGSYYGTDKGKVTSDMLGEQYRQEAFTDREKRQLANFKVRTATTEAMRQAEGHRKLKKVNRLRRTGATAVAAVMIPAGIVTAATKVGGDAPKVERRPVPTSVDYTKEGVQPGFVGENGAVESSSDNPSSK